MLRTFGWLAAGLVVATMVVLFMPRSGDQPYSDSRSTPTVSPVSPVSSAPHSDNARDPHADIAALTERLARLEGVIAELGEAVANLHAQGTQSEIPAADPVSVRSGMNPTQLLLDRVSGVATTPETARARNVERMVEQGLSPVRAEWIQQRSEELMVELMQQRYEAERSGETPPGFLPDNALRTEIGDADYEAYLRAQGRPDTINITGILSGSPAAAAGLQAGDRILSYAGTRVFDMQEINPLIMAGTPGESVMMEIERQGQRTQVVVPRGPLGIMMAGESSGLTGIRPDRTVIRLPSQTPQ